MAVGDYCRKPALTAHPAESVRSAARRMAKEGVGCLVVIDDWDRPSGMLTDRDAVLQTLCKRLDPGAVRVGEVASHATVSIREDASLAEAARRMGRHGVRRLPVVDSRGIVVGLISADDILSFVSTEMSSLVAPVRAQLHPARGVSDDAYR